MRRRKKKEEKNGMKSNREMMRKGEKRMNIRRLMKRPSPKRNKQWT